MRDIDLSMGELESLVDRHIELSELFAARRDPARRAPPPPRLVIPAGECGAAGCLAALVDRALVAYEGRLFEEDSTILSLKAALAKAIVGESEVH
ncbi:MAG TPA: hypothetical protein PLB91_03390 [Spirochaetales bacterium]|nr:hypothetical protein [Spirochaetales bacterium]HRY55396.1 hypothetical protein [Spirochaetia bacterium]